VQPTPGSSNSQPSCIFEAFRRGGWLELLQHWGQSTWRDGLIRPFAPSTITSRLPGSNRANFRAAHDLDAGRDLDGNMCYKWRMCRECLFIAHTSESRCRPVGSNLCRLPDRRLSLRGTNSGESSSDCLTKSDSSELARPQILDVVKISHM
jgi:hypothetical protein